MTHIIDALEAREESLKHKAQLRSGNQYSGDNEAYSGLVWDQAACVLRVQTHNGCRDHHAVQGLSLRGQLKSETCVFGWQRI